MGHFKKIWFVIFFLVAVPAFGHDYYVDNSCPNNGDGAADQCAASPGAAGAWNSFTNVNWTTVGTAGNLPTTLWVSGGASGQTYAEYITVGASGTSDSARIYIKPNQGAGKNGKVTIDPNYAWTGSEWFVIKFSDVSYVTVDGRVGASTTPMILFTHGYYYGIGLSNGSRYIDIGYVESADHGSCDANGGNGTGAYLNQNNNNSDSAEIHHSVFHGSCADDLMSVWQSTVANAFGKYKIHDNEFYNGYENSVSLYGGGVDFYNNTIHAPIQAPRAGGDPHYNPIQMNGSYQRVYNNYVYGLPETGSNAGDAPIRYNPDTALEANFSHIRIFNNLFVSTTSPGASSQMPGITISGSDANMDSLVDVLVANNTIVGMPSYSIGVYARVGLTSDTFKDIYIVNNVVSNGARTTGTTTMQFTLGTSVTYGSWGDGKAVTVDGNLVYQGDAGVSNVAYAGTGYTYANFKGQCTSPCQDTDAGSPVDPALDGSYKLTSSSPARSAGIDLTSYCAETAAICLDKNGNARPNGSAWDIGAYNYVAVGSVTSGGATSGGGTF